MTNQACYSNRIVGTMLYYRRNGPVEVQMSTLDNKTIKKCGSPLQAHPSLQWSADPLIHGHSFSFHVANEDVKKDSVTQAELLFLNLSSLLETHAKLPLILHLQQDNCYREGKNQYVCAAMILLVVLGVFRATCLGFLRTGHSESDIFES